MRHRTRASDQRLTARARVAAYRGATGVPLLMSRSRRVDLLLAGCQASDGGAEMSGGVVPELGDTRMPIERRLDDAALHASTATMNQADFQQSSGGGRVDVFRDD